MLRPAMRVVKAALPLSLLVYFVWAYVDFDKFLALAGRTAPAPMVAYFGSLLAARWSQAVQTRIALQEAGIEVGSVEVFRVQLVAAFYTMFVPGDLVGGGVTWYMLKRLRGGGAVIAMILVYVRLVLLASAIPFVIFGLLMESRLHSASLFAALAAVSVATIAVTVPLVFRSGARISGSLLAALSRWLGRRATKVPKVLATLQECIMACASASLRSTSAVFGLGCLLHLLGAVGFWLAAEAAHANVPLHAFFWLWPLMIVVHMLPISFGGLGVRELTLIYVLNALYATSAESVLLLSMIGLLATTMLGLAGGVWNSFRAATPD
jgi:glycosyltransferase 2 family protein